jgi:hypothetical protein
MDVSGFLSLTRSFIRSLPGRAAATAWLVAAVVMPAPAQDAPPSGIDYRSARTDRRLIAARTDEPITIDGVLDEAAWSRAAIADEFLQSEPREGEEASEATEVRVLYDADHLYIGVFARDSDTGSVIVNELEKDFTKSQTDAFEVVLDTFRDERNGYQFAVNPGGAKWDAQMANEGRESNVDWDGVWTVRTRIADDGWHAEMAIPFKTLKFREADVQTWGINFQRLVRRKNEESFWAPIPRVFALDRVSLAGTLENLEGVRPGLNVRLKPYAVASMLEARGGRDYDGDVGFDVKYGITSGLTWDFTYNTDFSQVEADEQQINLTRFRLFFPEKRDFFLENSGIFQFGAVNDNTGGSRPNRIANDMIFFFSRRIGLSDEAGAVPILGGTRLSGRAGPFEIGVMDIEQRAADGLNATNFLVGRLRYNFLGNSDVGFMINNKEERNSPHHNRVFGGDVNLRFGQALSLNGYVARSSGPRGGRDNLSSRASFSLLTDRLNASGSITDVQEGFLNELGFVPRPGIRKIFAYVGPIFRPERLRAHIRQINPHIHFEHVTRGGLVENRYSDYHLPFRFHSGAQIEVGLNTSVEELASGFEIADGITIPAGTHEWEEYTLTARSDASRRVSGTLNLSTGTFYSGDKNTYGVTGAFRFSERLNTSFSYTHNGITLREGAFTTNLLGLRVNYAFTTSVFVKTFLQYNSESDQWSSNLRFNLIHRPLSDLFLVYNDRRDASGGRLIDRAMIVKLTYMIAR